MTTIEEVTRLLPVLTPFSMPDDEEAAQALYTLAAETAEQEYPGTTEGYCYLIAHLLSSKEDAVASEHLGSYSVSYENGSGKWLSRYNRLLHKRRMQEVTGVRGEHEDVSREWN